MENKQATIFLNWKVILILFILTISVIGLVDRHRKTESERAVIFCVELQEAEEKWKNTFFGYHPGEAAAMSDIGLKERKEILEHCGIAVRSNKIPWAYYRKPGSGQYIGEIKPGIYFDPNESFFESFEKSLMIWFGLLGQTKIKYKEIKIQENNNDESSPWSAIIGGILAFMSIIFLLYVISQN